MDGDWTTETTLNSQYCTACHNTGQCPSCDGDGFVTTFSFTDRDPAPCQLCGGTGLCPQCSKADRAKKWNGEG